MPRMPLSEKTYQQVALESGTIEPAQLPGVRIDLADLFAFN